MAVVFGVASKTDFKISLKRDPLMDLANFYYNVERYMPQDDAKAESTEVNMVDYGEASKTGYRKNKGKQKAIDGFGGPKPMKRESKYFFYTELTEAPKRIYLDTRR